MTQTTQTRQPTCRERWAAHKNSRFADLRKLWRAYASGENDGEHPELGSIYDYGLAFDYVDRDDQAAYWRYQLSWGGPSDEIRFFAGRPNASEPYRVEYWFLDWFDGYGRKLVGRDLELAEALWRWFAEVGSTENAQREALED